MRRLWKLLMVTAMIIAVVFVSTAIGCKAEPTDTAATEAETAAATEAVTAATEAETAAETEAETAAEAVAGSTKWQLGFSQLIFAHPYVQAWMIEQVKCDADYNCETLTKNAEANIETQIADIEALLALNPAVICVHPVDVIAVQKPMQDILDAGIPTVSAANKVDVPGNINALFEDYQTFVHYADIAAAYLKGKGNVALIVGPIGNYTSDMRQKGFEEGIAKYPDIKLLDVQASNWDTTKSVQITEDWLNKFDDIDIICYADDQIAAPAIEAIKSYNRDIKVFGYSGTADGINAIADGDMIATGLITPPMLAWFTMSLCYMLYRDVPISAEDVPMLETPVIMSQEMADMLVENGLDLSFKWITPDAVEAGQQAILDSYNRAAIDAKYNLK